MGRHGSALDEGRYRGVILKHTFGGSAEKGTPELAFVCRLDWQIVTGDDGTEREQETEPLERTVRRYLTDGTADNFVAMLQKLNYDRDSFDDLDPASQNAFDFYGKQVDLEMHYEEYKGKSVERWDFAREKRQKPLERSVVAKLNAAYGGRLKALRRDPNAPAPPPQIQQPARGTLLTDAQAEALTANGPASQDDSDIPF